MKDFTIQFGIREINTKKAICVTPDITIHIPIDQEIFDKIWQIHIGKLGPTPLIRLYLDPPPIGPDGDQSTEFLFENWVME